MHISTSIIASMLQNASSAIGPSTTQIGKTPETHVGTTTSWVAMITSPPIDPKCSHNFYSPDRELHTLIAFDPRLNAVANFTCLPREAAEWYSQKNLPFGATNGTVTSLGPIVCPGAYTTASTSQKDDISTMVYCCPSEYGFANPADHGMMYGCTAQQPLPITVHFPANPTASVERREASLPSKAMNIAGVAIIGWVFRPSLMSTPSLPSATSNSSPQANQGSGITLNGVFGIVFGILGAMILIFLFYFFHEWAKTHTRCGRKPSNDEEGRDNTSYGEAEDSPKLEGQVVPAPAANVGLEHLNPNGSRVSSAADTVVRNTEFSSSRDDVPIVADDNADRTA